MWSYLAGKSRCGAAISCRWRPNLCRCLCNRRRHRRFAIACCRERQTGLDSGRDVCQIASPRTREITATPSFFSKCSSACEMAPQINTFTPPSTGVWARATGAVCDSGRRLCKRIPHGLTSTTNTYWVTSNTGEVRRSQMGSAIFIDEHTCEGHARMLPCRSTPVAHGFFRLFLACGHTSSPPDHRTDAMVRASQHCTSATLSRGNKSSRPPGWTSWKTQGDGAGRHGAPARPVVTSDARLCFRASEWCRPSCGGSPTPSTLTLRKKRAGVHRQPCRSSRGYRGRGRATRSTAVARIGADREPAAAFTVVLPRSSGGRRCSSMILRRIPPPFDRLHTLGTPVAQRPDNCPRRQSTASPAS